MSRPAFESETLNNLGTKNPPQCWSFLQILGQGSSDEIDTYGIEQENHSYSSCRRAHTPVVTEEEEEISVTSLYAIMSNSTP